MAVCPVCSFEEEDVNAVVCSVCGSDLEVAASPAPEPAEASSEPAKKKVGTPPVEEGPEEIPDEPEAPIPGDEVSSTPSTTLGQYSASFVSLLGKFRQRMDILFLDEPTAGLDPIGAAAFDQLIRTLCDALGLSVFLVTHDLDTLYAICDRVAVLSQKRVLIADTLERVAETDDVWIQDYFHGPRGRAASYQQPTPAKE